jgi:2-isopropylmalate synthase
MSDCILDSLKKGHLVIWEEIARDGAQAKTLLSGTDRVTTARMMGDLFHDSGPDHLVFAAGYPSIGKEEFEAVALVADQVDNCSLATHGRMLRHDIDLGIQTMSRAAFGRASFVVPISEKYSRIILHQSAEKTLQQGIDLARYALDNARGLPVDTALGGASIAEPSFLSDAANAFFEEGIATVKLCDTVGHMYPLEMDNHIQKIINGCAGRSNQLGVHLHNDLGFALASSMNAVSKGIRMVCTSWFGIAERIGLAPTELMLFVLALPKDQLTKRTGIAGPLWEKFPNLPRIKDISSFRFWGRMVRS